MTPRFLFSPRIVAVAAAGLAAGLLAACGGGGGSASDGSMSASDAQGYAADAATMPVSAATAVESSVGTLENALAVSAAAGTSEHALSAQTQALTGTVACLGGGTIAWSVSGSTPALEANGQFDTGEVYAVTFTQCGSPDGDAVLDGSVTLTVNQRTATSVDLTHTTSALTLTTSVGQWVVNGSTRASRAWTGTSGGGTQVSSQLSSSGVSLSSTIGSWQASYALKSIDWTVVRSYDASGQLSARSHQGTLAIDASTRRRPNASLQITTNGALTIGSDGLAAAGSFSVVDAHDTIACTYGNGTLTLTLDLGNDGTIDRSWTVTRTDFDGSAG